MLTDRGEPHTSPPFTSTTWRGQLLELLAVPGDLGCTLTVLRSNSPSSLGCGIILSKLTTNSQTKHWYRHHPGHTSLVPACRSPELTTGEILNWRFSWEFNEKSFPISKLTGDNERQCPVDDLNLSSAWQQKPFRVHTTHRSVLATLLIGFRLPPSRSRPDVIDNKIQPSYRYRRWFPRPKISRLV